MGETAEKIFRRTARIGIVDGRANVLEAFKAVATRAGFQSIEVFAGHEQLLHALGGDPFLVDWVLTPLHEHAKINSLVLLEKLASLSALHHVRVSLFLSHKQTQCLPKAFELGLLSWHDADFQTKSLSREIKTLLDRIETLTEGEAYIAAEYFREYLNEFKVWDELINLEQGMWNRYYDDQNLALNLAEALFKSGSKNQGRIVINQAQFFNHHIADRAAQLQALYLGSSGEGDGSFAAKHSISTAVIIDHDDQHLQLVKEVLWKIGVNEVSTFKDGEQAWQHLSQNPEPHLIIQEWQLPALTGPYFIQRVRAHGFRNVPIIILNSQLIRADIQLLKEMGASHILKKPITAKQLAMAIAWTIQQHREPTEIKALERRIVQALQNREVATARSLRDRFLKMEDVPRSRAHYVSGMFAYQNQRYEEALTHLINAVRESDGDNVDVIAMLARCLMKLRDYKAALALMEKASNLSPKNLERLCELAEIKMETGLVSEAGATIESAKAQDEQNPGVMTAEAKFNVIEGNVDKARGIMEQINGVEDVVAFMNNMAVGRTRTGAKQEGIQLYKKTLQSIPKKNTELSAIVNYNLGLALIKSGEDKLGFVYVKRAVDSGDSPVYDRAISLHDRMNAAYKAGQPFKLAERSLDDDQLLAVEQSNRWDTPMRARLFGDSQGGSPACLRSIFIPKALNGYTEYLLSHRKPAKAS